MSKRTKKCPDCGAQMSQNAARCSRCGYRASPLESERAASLPRPIRPEMPKPMETSRWPETSEYRQPAEKSGKAVPQNMIQLITVAVLVLAIVVLAVVLVVKMNKPVEGPAEEAGNVSSTVYIDENGNVVVGTQPPAEENNTIPTEITPAPTEAPEPSPEATEVPETEPEATPEPSPEATEAPEAEVDEPLDPTITISEMNDTIYVDGNSVNIRIGPGTEYNVVASLSRGEKLERTGTTDNGWSRVKYDGEKAYISNSYVSTEKPEPVVSDKSGTVVVKDGANLRKGPGTEHDVAKTVDAGTELERTGVSDNSWTRVKVDGEELYISNSLVEEKVSVTDKDGTVVLTAEANLRKGPGTGYDVIATKEKGTELERTGETENSWVRVKYDGKDAYVHNSLVEMKESSSDDDEPAVEEKSGTVTVTEGANVRKGPGTDYDKIGLAYVGTELKVTGKSGEWYEVEFDGQKGYIAADLVKEN